MKAYIALLRSGQKVIFITDDVKCIFDRLECVRDGVPTFTFVICGDAILRIDEICAITEKVQK